MIKRIYVGIFIHVKTFLFSKVYQSKIGVYLMSILYLKSSTEIYIYFFGYKDFYKYIFKTFLIRNCLKKCWLISRFGNSLFWFFNKNQKYLIWVSVKTLHSFIQNTIKYLKELIFKNQF